MRGEILYKILKALKETAQDQVDFVDAFLSAGYGATGNKIEYKFQKIQKERRRKEHKREIIVKFRKYLSKLKKDGLIKENDLKQIYLSEKGAKKLTSLKSSVSFNKYEYKKEVGDRIIVVSYDIPIEFNTQRAILRDILRMIGFNLIHKSVWVGKVKLPEKFIVDIKRLGIMDFVEILEVTKSGTLKSVN